MSWQILFQHAAFLFIVWLLVKPVGTFLARVFEGQPTFLDPLLRPIERAIYRVAGIDAAREMSWKVYAESFVLFGVLGTLLLFVILRVQTWLPFFDPTFLTTPLTPDLAFNTAVSFATTTTWQAYGGETTMSYTSQMLGLTAQNFLAGAAGLAVGIAFIRGLVREASATLGNFWVDVTRATLYVLLPASALVAIALVWQGVPMNFNPFIVLETLQGNEQIIAQGPVAALEAIKNLGTNGGGFFNVNGAHPYENPTLFTNWLEMLSIVVIPAALTYTFGVLSKRPLQGWVLFWIMMFLFVVGLLLTTWMEQNGNPQFVPFGVDQSMSEEQAGGNMEGKEVRFGAGGSALTATATSNGATGSYNSMHDSYMPLGGMIPLVNMLLGEIIFGGLGTGFYSIIVIALIGVFIAGLMVGRTPEYLGKPLDPTAVKFITLYTLIAPLTISFLTALAVITPMGLAGLTTNQGAHGFTEIFYGYTSSFANNGQNFAGLNANSLFYNITTALAMWAGRFGLGVLALAIAGYFAAQKCRPTTLGTLPTDSLLFAVLTIAVILIVGGLAYFPALAMGPLVEHLMLRF